MEMIRVSSSAIAAVGYDPLGQRLKIRFVQGHTYDYSGVPQHVHAGPMQASSIRHYHNDPIRDRYQG